MLSHVPIFVTALHAGTGTPSRPPDGSVIRLEDGASVKVLDPDMHPPRIWSRPMQEKKGNRAMNSTDVRNTFR